LLDVTYKQIDTAKKAGTDHFKSKNDSQVYKARDLSLALAEYYILTSFRKRFYERDVTDDLKPVLAQIFLIYGLWCIDKHLVTFYIGRFASGPDFGDFVRSSLLQKCQEIKDSVVTIADSLAPPDWVLNSVLGRSDGRLYEHLQNAFMSNPGAMEKASWWKDVVTIKSKL
jgi:acyl-CoA oxidase